MKYDGVTNRWGSACLGVLLTLGLCLFVSPSWADEGSKDAVPVLAVEAGSGAERIQVEVIPVEAENELPSAQGYMADRVRELRTQGVPVNIVVTEDLADASGQPSANRVRAVAQALAAGDQVQTAQTPQEWSSMRSRFSEWFSQHYRLTFALVRVVFNGGVTAANLMISKGVPPVAAGAVGLLIGGLSGAAMYHNAVLQKFFVGNIGFFSRALRQKEDSKGKAGLDKAEELTRWWATEVVFLGTIRVMSGVINFFAPGTVPELEGSVLKTAAYSTGAQGIFDVGVAKETHTEKALQPERAKRIQLMSDSVTLVSSFVSVAAATAQLIGMPIGDVLMWGLSITGAVNYARVIYKYRKSRSVRAFCRDLFLAPVSP